MRQLLLQMLSKGGLWVELESAGAEVVASNLVSMYFLPGGCRVVGIGFRV
jgi:hypothetical protein